jgi:hypothetical protein
MIVHFSAQSIGYACYRANRKAKKPESDAACSNSSKDPVALNFDRNHYNLRLVSRPNIKVGFQAKDCKGTIAQLDEKYRTATKPFPA